ncbi:MAG: hypothetical protein Q7R63_00605 [bacterium]|nr:hypothetical protein [bacterium]
MDRLKKGMRWIVCSMLFVGMGFCGVAFRAIDDKILYDAVSHEKIGMMHMLGILFLIFTVMLTAFGLAYAAIRMFRNNDPDVGTNDDGKYVFDAGRGPSYSPIKPR